MRPRGNTEHNNRLAFARRFVKGIYCAARVTRKAVKAGELLNPKTLRCVDCGRAAHCYDHRDYNRPLVVEPVCHKCNGRRGSGVPKEWTLEEVLEEAAMREANISGERKPKCDRTPYFVIAYHQIFG